MNMLLTGLTGLVGASFAVDMLRNSPELRLTALVRSSRGAKSFDRLVQAISEQCAFDGVPALAGSFLKRISVVDGDLTSIPVEALETHGPFDVFFHCAADVNLGKDADGRTFETNLRGTRNALALAKKLSIPAFHYVSTAYVAGQCSGRVMEDSLPATDFNNAYERSKFEAEKLVRASGLSFTIYRPSIVVGRRTDGAIRRPLAFYRLLEFLAKVKRHRCSKAGVPASTKIELPLRLVAPFSDRIYFVPIDYVQSSIARLFRLCPQGNGKAYHITGESPVSLKDIQVSIENSLGAKGIVVMEKVPDPRPEEKLVMKLIGDLMPYFSSQIIFDNSNVKAALGAEALAWRVDLNFLEKISHAYFKANFPDVLSA